MANDSGFPSSRAEALAYLYTQAQDLRGKTPSEINTMFHEAYYEIRRDNAEKQKSNWAAKLKEVD